MMSITNKKVTVIGLGKSGVAVAKLLVKNGCRVKVTETDSNPALQSRAEELRKLGIIVELGEHRESFYTDAELVVPCPGVKPNSLPIQWAKQRKIPILSETEVAYRSTPCPIVELLAPVEKQL